MRADRVIANAVTASGDVLIFAHGHILRSLGARWIGLDVAGGERLALFPGAVSILGHEQETRVLERWNGPPGPDG